MIEFLDALSTMRDAGMIGAVDRAVVGDPRDHADRWADIDGHGVAISGRSVLVVASAEDGDAAAFWRRGAGHVQSVGAGALDAADTRAELVHCHGLLHRAPDPVGLLRALHRVTAPGGSLLLSALVLDDPERAEYLRFVPDSRDGDGRRWFIPGRLALRSLLTIVGFRVDAEFGRREAPRDRIATVSGYLLAGRHR